MKIRIFNNEILKNNKTKLNRKKAIAGFLIAASLFTTPISVSAQSNDTYLYSGNDPWAGLTVSMDDVENKENESKTVNNANDSALKSELSKKVTITSNENSVFDTYLKANPANFEYEEHYHIDEALNKEANYQVTDTKNHSDMIELKNGRFDGNIIADRVIKNSKEYKSVDIAGTAFYTELNNQQTKDVCEIIANSLNYEIDHNKNLDLDELRSVVADLKIYETTGLSHAYVDSDKILMAISPDIIDVTSVLIDSNTTYEDVITHEAKHLTQISCAEDLTDAYEQIGVSKEWSDLKVNPLKWNWLYEASAERLSTVQTGHNPVTYKRLLSYLDTLKISSMFNNKTDMNIEQLSGQEDSSLLYKMFNCETQEEKKELVKLMYSIDVLQYTREDFFNEYGELSEEELTAFNLSLKQGICESTARFFYKGLTDKVESNSMSLHDVFYLIRVFEADNNTHLICEEESKLNENQKYMSYYLDLQNEFFTVLADSNNMDLDEVNRLFDEYQPENNYNVECLSAEENNFLRNKLSESVTTDKANQSIKQIYNSYGDNVKKK